MLLLCCFVGRAQADEIRVCVRPSNIPANVGRWAYTTGTGTLLTSDAAVFAMKTHGQDIYVFDPQAPEKNTRLFPIPYHKLQCPPWVPPTENEAIAEYAVMRKFTQNMGGRWQAHHILERSMVREFGLGNAEKMPSVILTEAQHKAITAQLQAAAAVEEIRTTEQLWRLYQKAYANHPHWLKAIEPYFVNCK